MTRAISVLLAGLVLLLGAALGVAEEQPSPADLLATEKQLEQSELRQKELDEKLDASIREEETLSGKLVQVASELRDEEQRLRQAETKVAALQKDRAKLNLELAERQDELSDVLAGLQRLEQNPPPALAVRPLDVLAALRSAMLFGTLAPDLKRAAENVQTRLATLADMETRLAEETRAKEEALLALAGTRGDMNRLIEEKRALAKSLKLDIEGERKRSEALARKAETLRDLLAALAAEEAKRAAEESKAEKERLAAEQRRKELANVPKIAFADAKGQLAYPASGQIAKRFGEDTGLGHPLDGIVIATTGEADVTSPVQGRVEFSGPFRSYGEMVIINPGSGYLVLLAGLGQVNVAPGQSVMAGEPVGRMGKKPQALALAKDLPLLGNPVLYIEFRKNGDPVDPTPWWSGPEPKFANKEAMR